MATTRPPLIVPIGTDLRVRHRARGLLAGQRAEKAWLTCKAMVSYPDDQAIFQKVITRQFVYGQGRIVKDGSDGGPVEMEFDLTAEETARLPARDVWYDVKVRTDDGKVYRAGPVSRIRGEAGVTRATA